MKIFFIRHGETTGDIENRYGGNYDDHLSEKGIEQSADVAYILKNEKIEKIFASSLVRARETAAAIAQESKCSVLIENDIRERNQYGILTGMEKGEAKKKYPELAEALRDRLNTIEGAESYEDFRVRVIASFERILKGNSGSTIALVTHGGPLRVLFRDYLKWGELKEIGDCCFVELEKNGNDFFLKKSQGLVFDFTPATK
jgi:broad specificity phosphatase PhoE